MPIRKSSVVFLLLLLGVFCVTGLGLFAPTLRGSLVNTVLGLGSGKDSEGDREFTTNDYIRQIETISPISERLKGTPAIQHPEQFPDLGAPKGKGSPEPKARIAGTHETPAPSGPTGKRDKNKKPLLGTGSSIKYRMEIQSHEFKDFIENVFPHLVSKEISTWDGEIKNDRLYITAKLDLADIKNTYRKQIPAVLFAVLADTVVVNTELSIEGKDGKATLQIHNLNLGKLPVPEQALKLAITRILESQGRKVEDPMVHVFDLPEEIETITVKNDTLIINEQSVLKMTPAWQKRPGRPQHPAD